MYVSKMHTVSVFLYCNHTCKSCDRTMEEPILDNFYHYPPDLLAVLIETIPTLVKSKVLLLSFFRNAGVSASILEPYEELIARDSNLSR